MAVVALLQSHEGADGLAGDLVGLSYYRGFGYGGMTHQGAFYFQGESVGDHPSGTLHSLLILRRTSMRVWRALSSWRSRFAKTVACVGCPIGGRRGRPLPLAVETRGYCRRSLRPSTQAIQLAAIAL